MLPSHTLPALPAPGQAQTWHGLSGSAAALALAGLLLREQRTLLAISPDNGSADQLEQALHFFLPAAEHWRILRFPDREILPYDVFSPHQDLVSDRLRCLHRLQSGQTGFIVICAIHTAIQKLPPAAALLSRMFLLARGDRLGLEALKANLVRAGYRAVDTVHEHGEFAARGALLDVFPMGSALPLRIDLDDDRIDSLRSFDPETQRSLTGLERVDMLPAREYPLDEAARTRFRQHWHESMPPECRNSPVYRDISQGRPVPGGESYLPYFFEHPCKDLLAWLDTESPIVLLPGSGEAADHFQAEIHQRFTARQGDLHYPPLPAEQLYSRPADFFARCKSHPLLRLDAAHPAKTALPMAAPPALPAGTGSRYARLATLLGQQQDRVLLCADSAGRQAILGEQLRAHGLTPEPVSDWSAFAADGGPPLALMAFALDRGLHLPEQHLLLLTESELFDARVPQRRRRQKSSDGHELPFRDLAELRPGMPVVHSQHGVGRYQGLERLSVDGQTQEFLSIHYAGDTRLYVPVTDIHLVGAYSGSDPELAPLHRLGSEQWQKARQKAFDKVRDVAAELLALQAQREVRGGRALHAPADELERFSEGFPFEETADQLSAIEAVLADLAADRPMDRLVCGDVGFGKTEVALRAAFVAACNGRQVAVLVPTTLLAQQHFETFRDRFANWPVRVEVISRFRSKTEQQALLADLADGRIDIVIGTHRLLQDDVRLKRLGLLIVDEEHRFGVRHKERIKALRAGVDILTLTATPIPRTLNQAFTGLRDLSIIATPPARRLTIHTFVRQHDSGLLREAILREILRGGQVYYLHNDVASIERTADHLRRLIPEASFGIGHGQMSERELERVMADFYHRRFQVLVCSTIIETGIDIPNANTILIDRADRFGLAQLHQLRGRVGRSHHQAYAYLLVPDLRNLGADAEKRLDAIAAAEDLGSGFLLASQDLEIRGAGELLGEEQSGQIASVGLSLYLDMLQRAVAAIRNGEDLSLEATLAAGPELAFPWPALIPETYIPDIQTRLQLYRRIAETGHQGDAEALQVEMIDRFGLLPDPVRTLFAIADIKAVCQRLGIRKLDVGRHGIRCHFSSATQINPMQLIQLIQQEPQHWRLVDGQQLLWKTGSNNSHDALAACTQLLERLQAPVEPRPAGRKAR